MVCFIDLLGFADSFLEIITTDFDLLVFNLCFMEFASKLPNSYFKAYFRLSFIVFLKPI